MAQAVVSWLGMNCSNLHLQDNSPSKSPGSASLLSQYKTELKNTGLRLSPDMFSKVWDFAQRLLTGACQQTVLTMLVVYLPENPVNQDDHWHIKIAHSFLVR